MTTSISGASTTLRPLLRRTGLREYAMLFLGCARPTGSRRGASCEAVRSCCLRDDGATAHTNGRPNNHRLGAICKITGRREYGIHPSHFQSFKHPVSSAAYLNTYGV